MEALALANQIRIRRANLKRNIRQGKLDPVKLLEGGYVDWEEAFTDTTVEQFLMAIPRFGRITVQEILNELKVNGTLKLQYLTIARRKQLANMVRMVKGFDSWATYNRDRSV